MVTVIIPVYNGEKFIEEAIISVLNQTYKDMEVLVIDDGSEDGTSEIVKKYEPKVKYIYQSNKGPSAARNLGMDLAKGEYLAFLDADDTYEPTKIEKQVMILNTYPDVDVVYADANMMDVNGNLQGIYKSEWCFDDHKDFLAMLIFRQIVPMPPAIMIRKKCYLEGISYNSDYVHAEDYDFIIRLAQKYHFKYLKEPLYNYRRHSDNLTNNRRKQLDAEIRIIQDLGIDRITQIVKDSNFSKIQKQMLLGKVLLKIKEIKMAFDVFKELTVNSSEPYAWFYVGICYYWDNNRKPAMESFKQAILKEPNMAEAYNNYGCLVFDENSSEAIKMFQRAIELVPNYLDANDNLLSAQKGEVPNQLTFRELRRVLMLYNR